MQENYTRCATGNQPYWMPLKANECNTVFPDAIETCSKVFQYYGRVDGILCHDDWGTARAGFCSNEMFREQIMPATKRFFDYVKGQEKFIELHSCGKNIQYVPEMIEPGIDLWSPQLTVNDPDELYRYSLNYYNKLFHR